MTISPAVPVTLRTRDTVSRVPSAFRLRSEMNGIAEAPGKVWFWELAAAVVDADRCVRCGACVAACPTDSIGIGRDDLPMLVKMCTGCSLCWDFCPRGGLRYEATWQQAPAGTPREAPASASPAPVERPDRLAGDALGTDGLGTDGLGADGLAADEDWRITGADPAPGLGVTLHQVAARVPRGDPPAPAGQDGGVVTAILLAALSAGEIDGALVAREDPEQTWKGVPFLATTPEEIRLAAGSFYNQTMALACLDLAAAGLPPDARVALVGTPCEIQGIRALQARQWRRGRSRVDAVALTIALLCTKSFDYRSLMLAELRDERGLDLAEIGRVDVIRGRLLIEDRSGGNLLDEPIKNFHGAALKGCDECADFLGRAADLSVGSVGSDDGWSSVLVRTETGRRAFELAERSLETAPLPDPAALERLDRFDKKAARSALQRQLDPTGPLFIDWSEHVTFYAGTERAPVWR